MYLRPKEHKKTAKKGAVFFIKKIMESYAYSLVAKVQTVKTDVA